MSTIGSFVSPDSEEFEKNAEAYEELLEHELPGQVMKAGICGHLTEGS